LGRFGDAAAPDDRGMKAEDVLLRVDVLIDGRDPSVVETPVGRCLR
jgi:hypothetical protein